MVSEGAGRYDWPSPAFFSSKVFGKTRGLKMNRNAGLSVYLLSLFGIGLLGVGIYFLFVRPELLPEDVRYMSLSDAQKEILQSLASSWLKNVFRVLGGFIAAAGILFIFLAFNSFRRFQTWSWYTAMLSGITSIGTMTVVNFKIQSDFRWWILSLAIIWFCALVSNVFEKRR